MEETNESREFWAEKAAETGKDIVFRSFAKFIGEKGRGETNLSGLLYATDDSVYFEDFEKTSMLDMLMKKKRKYEKFSMSFSLSDAVQMRKVSASSASACAAGSLDEAKEQNILNTLFNAPAWEIKFKTGESYFFELFEPKALIELITK